MSSLATLELGKLGAKAQRRNESGRTGAGTRAAKNGPLQRCDAAPVANLIGAEPGERMLEQRQQLRRRQAASRRFRNEPAEYAGRRIGQRVAACIVGHDVPALQHHGDPSRQRAVRRHQRSRAVRL
jgi:hypothetical protein